MAAVSTTHLHDSAILSQSMCSIGKAGEVGCDAQGMFAKNACQFFDGLSVYFGSMGSMMHGATHV